MKILLEYDPVSGTVTDAKGNYIAGYVGAVGFEEEQTESSVAPKRELTDQLAHLKTLGIEVNGIDDLIRLKENNIL